MPRRRSVVAPDAPDDEGVRLARVDTWAGLRAGDEVDVLDERERRATFRFVAHVTNRVTSDTWVEVVGGRGAERRIRAFRPEQLYPARTVLNGVATGPSLAVAPRLQI